MNAAVIRRRALVSAVALIFFACAFARGQDSPPPEIPVEQWLQGPDRQDFEWKVYTSPPRLTFQQRQIVQLHASLQVPKLRNAGVSLQNLHFVVKIAKTDGPWFRGQAYAPFSPPAGLDALQQIHSVTTLYLRPGKFKVAVLAFDALHRRGNLWRGIVEVAPLKDDPLPSLDRDLPAALYIPPLQFVTNQKHLSLSSITFNPPEIMIGRLSLPVANVRPIQLDVVANLSLSDAANTRHSQAPPWMYRVNAALLLQMSNVLSQLDLKGGCVRVSAVDILRQKVFLDRQDARDLDWNAVRGAVDTLQRNKIDVRVLAAEKKAPAFLSSFIEQVLTGPSACSRQEQPPLHVLIFVSDAFIFPIGTAMTAVRSETIPESQCYYLKVEPVVGASWDEIGRVLKPLHPLKLSTATPTQFRRVLHDIIVGIQSSRPDAKASAPPH